jgi:hypothetical protein
MIGLEPKFGLSVFKKLKYSLPIGWLPTYLANYSKPADFWQVQELPNVGMRKRLGLSAKCPN